MLSINGQLYIKHARILFDLRMSHTWVLSLMVWNYMPTAMKPKTDDALSDVPNNEDRQTADKPSLFTNIFRCPLVGAVYRPIIGTESAVRNI